MAAIPLHSVLDHLRRQHNIATAVQRSDRDLLRKFVTNNDQGAFEIVVTRHAPLVWGVCRRILGHHQDAEDAFQATFLILARRAGSIRWRSSVGGWLHTVAQRLAVRARRQAEQRRLVEREASRTPAGDSSLRDLAAVVDEELRRLPAKYRDPLLLHYLEGATAEAAARQLGVSRGTFYNRLTHGRELLRGCLSRQGLSLAAPLLAAALTAEAEAASPSLIQATIRGVMGTVPERVAALVAEVLGITTVTKLKIGLALGLLLGMAGGGVAMLTPGAPIAPIVQTEHPAEPPEANKKSVRRVDRDGDPLPQGAVARLGTRRFRIEFQQASELTFAPDGKTLAVASPVGLYLFDAATGIRMKSPRPLNTSFWQVAFSPDSKQLLVAAQRLNPLPWKTAVQIWDVAGGRKTTEVELEHILRLGWTTEGQPMVACESKGEIILLDIATGQKRSFSAKDLSNDIFSHSAVGRSVLAAAGNAKNIVHVWDISSGKERWTLKTWGVFSTIHSLVLSPDEQWLASLTRGAADESTMQLWDLTTGKAKRIASGDQQQLSSVAFTADSKTLATIGRQDVRFWDTASGRERGRLKGEGRSFNPSAVSFTPDGKTLAVMEDVCGAIHLWDVATGECKPEPEGHSTSWFRPPAFSPDGERVATSGSMDGTIRVWETASGRQLSLLRRSPSTVLDCAFSADRRTLVSCWDDRVLLSDAATGRELNVLEANDWRRLDQRPNLRMHVSSDGRKAIVLRHGKRSASGGVGGAAGGGPFTSDWLMTCWDTSTRKQLFQRQLAYQGSERELAVSPDATLFALPGSMREPMRLVDVETEERLLTFPIHKRRDHPLAFSADGRLLLSHALPLAPPLARGFTRTLHLWEMLTASELLASPIPIASHEAAISADGRLLAAISPQREILLWDLKTDKELHRFKDFGSGVSSLVFSPDSRRLVSCLYDSTLLVWDVPPLDSEPAGKLGADKVTQAWSDLAGPDAARAFRARWTLVSAPEQAISLLRKHLHPAQSAEPQRLRRLLADLQSEQFDVREKAQKELEALGDVAEPALRKTLASKPALEVRRRVEAVLERLRGPVTRPELLQSLRAVAVLEGIGTPEARRLLEVLVKGAPEARLTSEANTSLQRLERRGAGK